MTRAGRTAPHWRKTAAAVGCVAAAVLAAGCSSIREKGEIDYRSQGTKTAPLDVPPDLSQLAREGRIRPPGETVSASAGAAGATSTAAPAAAPAPTVAVAAVGDVRVERDGQQRWLVVARPPEVLWPLVRAFWLESGFKLVVDNAQTGVIETDWAEDRSRIPKDFIRSTLGRIFDGLYDSGVRDRYRTRLERTAAGTEIYLSHRRTEEVYTSVLRDSTRWQTAASDPQLEAEFLSRLMARIAPKDEKAAGGRTSLSETSPLASAAPSVGSDARLLLDDGFDRSWRRVGLALDRSGFSVEDRDRAAGLYFVRYVDASAAGKEEPNVLARLFRSDRPTAIMRYRILVKAEISGSSVTLQDSEGKPQSGEAARLILARLAETLR